MHTRSISLGATDIGRDRLLLVLCLSFSLSSCTLQVIQCCSDIECVPPLAANVGELQLLHKCSQATNFTEFPATPNFTDALEVQNASDSDDTCPVGTIACAETVRVSSEEWAESFTAYMVIRITLDILRASSLMLFEGAVVVIIKVLVQGDTLFTILSSFRYRGRPSFG